MSYTASMFQNKKIIFHGNSLFDGSALAVAGGRYCETKIYTNIIATKQRISAMFLSESGNTTTLKINEWATETLPVIRENDVVVLWEITNDVKLNALTGQQAYDNVVTFANLVRGVGAKIVVMTAVARDYATDTTEYTRNVACNALINSNSNLFDLVIDSGGQTNFVNQADASNATYYNADKLHLVAAGYDSVASYASTQLLASNLL